VTQPGRLLASGRDSDIFEYGDGLVLRRSRHGSSMATEARTMEHARTNGYPVPAVDHVSDDGTELVMERITGPSMIAALGRRPWTLKNQAGVLADLHLRLHEIVAPAWLGPAPGTAGDRLLHLDLHPLNVMLSPRGPVVIDWPNAARGDPAADVGVTWVLLAAAGIPAGRLKAAALGRLRSLIVDAFVGHFDRAAVSKELAAVVEWKVRDAHMTPAEQQAMRNLVAGVSGRR
jgi:aminoglycoside phosphotransferase (APT) family kinase protein